MAMPALLVAAAGCAVRASLVPSPYVPRAQALVAAGDTAAALALLDSAVRRQFTDAAAWHLRGMLAWGVVRPSRGEGLVKTQQSIALLRMADSSLRLAAQLAPDSGRYQLDLGRYFLFADFIFLRVQAYGKLHDALEIGRRTNDRPLIAEAADEVGMLNWRRYEAVAHRRGLTGVTHAQLGSFLESWKEVPNFLENRTIVPPEPSGELDYTKAVQHFDEALAANPDYERGGARPSGPTRPAP
jgi:tetratricopeptide (TPR) repeat protein